MPTTTTEKCSTSVPCDLQQVNKGLDFSSQIACPKGPDKCHGEQDVKIVVLSSITKKSGVADTSLHVVVDGDEPAVADVKSKSI